MNSQKAFIINHPPMIIGHMNKERELILLTSSLSGELHKLNTDYRQESQK